MAKTTHGTIEQWFETALDLMSVADPALHILKASTSWLRLTGWSEKDLVGHTLIEFIHPDDGDAFLKKMESLQEGNPCENLQSRLRKKDGGYLWLSWNITPAMPEKEVLYIVAHDISEMKQKEIAVDNDIHLLEMAEQTAKVGHWRLDVATGHLQWSNEVFNIYGRRPHKAVITLDDFIDAFSGRHQKELWSLVQRALDHGHEINTELVLMRDNSDRRTVAIRAVCERDTNNVVTALFGIIQDVTEERLHQASLRSKEELLSMAFRATSDGIWDWDLKTDQVWFSPQWKAQLGYDEEEISNRFESWANLIFEEDRVKAMDLIDAHFRGDLDRLEMIQRFRHKKGHTVYILSRAYALRDEQGKAVRMIGAHTDVTELKQLEQVKSEFTSIVSHELRTPLTAIHGAIGLLNGHYSEGLNEQARSLVKIALNNSERLNLLVNDILDIERLQSGKMSFDIEPISLRDFLSQVLTNHKSYASKFNVALDYDQSGDMLSVMGDRNRLMQVMANLVSNAIKFSHENQTVKIRAYHHNTKIAISVIDTGRGIARDMRDKIFDKFVQADSSDQRHKGGTGLGLTISKAMIEKMDGSISMVSKLNEGSTFTLLLPKA